MGLGPFKKKVYMAFYHLKIQTSISQVERQMNQSFLQLHSSIAELQLEQNAMVENMASMYSLFF